VTEAPPRPAIPLTGARGLRRLARRTRALQALVALVLAGLVLGVAGAARHPALQKQFFTPPKTGGMIVLDLSASISADTFSEIGATLQKLVDTHGRYGLVVFSSTAYQALPLGTPASALQPLVRYFTIPTVRVAGEAPTFPVNPWSFNFTGGTSISSGLDLARNALIAAHDTRAPVLLVSDLADDPQDIQRLTAVLLAYRQEGTPIRIVPLDAAPNDVQFFQKLLGNATRVLQTPTKAGAPPTSPSIEAAFPWTLVILALCAAALLAAFELWFARLRWGARAEAAA
jgi:hypothetical protein